ncbi:cell division protein SepF [Microbacterium sp. LRZ72]|uniref:cell division protein SepF n=1 Tax=Microbacterium sp. LRZ72 TaxID=2942481 RepID=UPI0029A4A654|nr:cell division protein SepF [Microbacterium sp. LRZ72]MDX2377177.1 cell division protein SepF [Microbacterium sp. LRZ72]
MANPLKKTMVYLGLADEEEIIDDTPQQTSQSRMQAVETPKGGATVTPLRRPTAVKQPATGGLSEILTVHPKQYRDAQVIAENFREGVPVIINLSQMSDADARRLVDFASGLSLGLHGRIERVTSKVFLLSPEHVAVSGDGGIAHADPEAAPAFAQA